MIELFKEHLINEKPFITSILKKIAERRGLTFLDLLLEYTNAGINRDFEFRELATLQSSNKPGRIIQHDTKRKLSRRIRTHKK